MMYNVYHCYNRKRTYHIVYEKDLIYLCILLIITHTTMT